MFNVFVQIIISYQWVEYITALTDHNNTFVLYELFLMLCSSVHSDTSERKRKRKRDKTSSAFLPLINHFAVNDKVPLIVKTKEGLFSVSLVCHFLFHEITTWQWKKSPWQQSHLTELLNRSCFFISFFYFQFLCQFFTSFFCHYFKVMISLVLFTCSHFFLLFPVFQIVVVLKWFLGFIANKTCIFSFLIVIF